MKCDSCGYENPDDALFCGICGEKLKIEKDYTSKPKIEKIGSTKRVKYCRSCYRAVERNTETCPYCGYKFENKHKQKDKTKNKTNSNREKVKTKKNNKTKREQTKTEKNNKLSNLNKNEARLLCVGECLVLLVLFLLLASASGLFDGFEPFGDDLVPEDIYITSFDTVFDDYGGGTTHYYSTSFNLKNVSSKLKGSEINIHFYSGNKSINDSFSKNSFIINDNNYIQKEKTVPISASILTDYDANITHIEIVMTQNGKVIFNDTKQFKMKNLDTLISSSTEKKKEEETDPESTGITYVASSNSNKFHYDYCTHADRIKSGHKITFSSRTKAINAGYQPCEICNP